MVMPRSIREAQPAHRSLPSPHITYSISNTPKVAKNRSQPLYLGPSLVLEKLGSSVSYLGSLVRYTLEVTNVGNETAYDVTVRYLIDLSLVG